MTFWAILILVVLVAGLVAYVGDLVAKRVGKRHWRFLGLRPKTTATLVAVGTGILIGLGAFGTFFLLVQQARETILQAESVRQERDRLRTEVGRLENRAASIFSQYEQLKIERDEFEKNNALLARQLAQNAELQRQTRQDLENVLVEREKLRQEVEKLQAASAAQREALEQLKQVRLSLLQEQERLQKEKLQLLASRTALLAQARKAEQQLQAFEAASREAKARLSNLQARTKELEAEKRRLEGDVAVLGSTPTPSPPSDDRLLKTLQQSNSELKGKLAEAQRELQQLRERTQTLATSLEKSLRLNLLAEELVMPGNEQVALNEISRRVDSRVRLIGLRGVEILVHPSLANLKPGVFLARIHSIGADGRVRVAIEYRAREQVFPQGEILATTTLLLPTNTSEVRRKLNALSQVAENRLTKAGWVPEKLAQGGIALEEFVSLAAQLFGKRGSARVAVVALDDLYPTEPPRLGLRLLP